MKKYYVLVNANDYNYAAASEAEYIWWHDYIKHGIMLNIGDIVSPIVTSFIQENWEVVDVKVFANYEDAMEDKDVYQFWNANFPKYCEDAQGRFLKLQKLGTKKWEEYRKTIPNHSIIEY